MAITSNRLRELDGLRAISVLLVIIDHCVRHELPKTDLYYNLCAGAGSTGVFIFFVISGYIITKLFIREQEKNQRVSIINFYLRRIFRIIPAFYFYLLVVFMLSYFGFLKVTHRELFLAGGFLANLPFVNMGWFVVHTWSLATEEQFYLFFPCVFILAMSFSPRKTFIFSWFLLYLIWGWLAALHYDGAAGPFFHISYIMSGVIISIYEKELKNWACKCNFSIVATFVVIDFLWVPGVINFPHEGILYIPFSCFVICLLLLKSIHGSTGLWAGFLLNPVIQWTGLCSYSIYLWQEMFTLHPSFIWTPIGIIGCSAISFYFIEKPLNRIGRKFVSTSTVLPVENQNGIVSACE